MLFRGMSDQLRSINDFDNSQLTRTGILVNRY